MMDFCMAGHLWSGGEQKRATGTHKALTLSKVLKFKMQPDLIGSFILQ